MVVSVQFTLLYLTPYFYLIKKARISDPCEVTYETKGGESIKVSFDKVSGG